MGNQESAPTTSASDSTTATATASKKDEKPVAEKEEEKYYRFNYSTLPDNLFHKDVPVSKWLDHCEVVGKEGFPPNSLNKVTPISKEVECERIVGIAMYMIGNVIPFALPILLGIAAGFNTTWSWGILYGFLAYCFVLFSLFSFYFKPKFCKKYNQKSYMDPKDVRGNQYFYTEYHISKYLSTNYIWPKKDVQRPALENTPAIFCCIPHGIAPFGITSYPLWSKLFNSKLCHWTTAPIVLKIPFISKYMLGIGYIPAKCKNILETLTKKEHNVGIILDGIAGMFQQSKSTTEELCFIKQRKGIIKIALRAGVPIVPVYGFGHTSMYKVLLDPFGILEYLSLKLDTSIVPFFGRWNWFLGPPSRANPVAICLGTPVKCPQISEPTLDDINKYHQQLLDSYEELFNKHKAAYGWSHKKIKFV